MAFPRALLDRLPLSSIRSRMLVIALAPALLTEFGMVVFFTSQTLDTAERALHARADNAARHLANALPYALVTGDTAPDTILRITQAGLPMLHKPLRPAKLRALLTHLIQQARSADVG